MDKKPSFLWALAIGLLFPILQALLSLLRFSSFNGNAQPANYLFFFIGGAFIGLGVVYFLRRSDTKATYRGTIIGFIIGIPFALMGMLLGGLASPIGVILFGMSPGIFITAIGYFIGRVFSPKK